jgi:hypothetical protein
MRINLIQFIGGSCGGAEHWLVKDTESAHGVNRVACVRVSFGRCICVFINTPSNQ